MIDIGAPRFGRWAWLALLVAGGTVLLSDANRFLPPVGEKYVDFAGRGASDLIPSFNAAVAFLGGQDPYHYDLRKLPDPYAFSRGQDEHVTYLYPPSHILIYVPIVWLARENFDVASRMQFFLSLFVLVALVLAVLDLVGTIVPLGLDLRCTLLVALTFILGLNPGAQLGLERGQSDLITAALCWWAAAAFCRGWLVTAAFLAVAGALLKGYGVALAPGLLLLGLGRERWQRTVLGALLALWLLLAPVARYLPTAVAAYRVRAKMFWANCWFNQSVFNLGHTLRPSMASAGRYVFVVAAGAICVIAWLRLARALQDRRNHDVRAIWTVLFATTSLAFVLGFSRNSMAYDAVIVLPGALLVALIQARLVPLGRPVTSSVVGVGMALMMFGLCAFTLPLVVGLGAGRNPLPIHGAALVGLVLLLGVVSVRGIASGTEARP